MQGRNTRLTHANFLPELRFFLQVRRCTLSRLYTRLKGYDLVICSSMLLRCSASNWLNLLLHVRVPLPLDCAAATLQGTFSWLVWALLCGFFNLVFTPGCSNLDHLVFKHPSSTRAPLNPNKALACHLTLHTEWLLDGFANMAPEYPFLVVAPSLSAQCHFPLLVLEPSLAGYDTVPFQSWYIPPG